MKSRSRLLPVLLLFLLLAGCQLPFLPSPDIVTPTSPLGVSSDPVWGKIQADGKAVVGISADYPPFMYVNDRNEVDGFELALLRAIGWNMDLPLDIRDLGYNALGRALETGEVDFIIAALSPTADRQMIADFTNPYYIGEAAVLGPNEITINSPADLARYRVGVEDGTSYNIWINSTLVDPGLMPPGQRVTFRTPLELVQAPLLTPPPVDVVLVDQAVAQAAARSYPLVVSPAQLASQPYAIAVQPGANELLQRLNQTLAELERNGTLADLAEQHLNQGQFPPFTPPVPTPIPPTPIPPTPTNIPCQNGMALVQHLTYDDRNMVFPPVLNANTPFQKGWRLLNTGTCPWDARYLLVYVDGNTPAAQMGGSPTTIPQWVDPGQTVDVYVNLVTPSQPGLYQGFWSMRTPEGELFGERIWVGVQVAGQIIVPPTPTSAPTPTSSAQMPFIQSFLVDRNQINQGACINLSWVYSSPAGSTATLQRNGVPIYYQPPSNGVMQDCPPVPGQIEYRLQVTAPGGTTVQQSQFVQVLNPAASPLPPSAPQIQSFEMFGPDGQLNPAAISLGQCVTLRWNFSGENLSTSYIARNGTQLMNNPRPSGQINDCPPFTGTIQYTLYLVSPGGTSQREIILFVTAE